MVHSDEVMLASYLSVKALIEKGARAWPMRIALQEGERQQTFCEMNWDINRLSNALCSSEWGAPRRVAILAENSIPYFHFVYACGKLGSLSAGLNWRATFEEWRAQLALLEPDALVVDASNLPKMEGLLAEQGSVCLLITIGLDDERVDELDRRHQASVVAYERLIEGALTSSPPGDVEPETPFGVFFTSGTTGAPKGIVVSHRAMVHRASGIAWLTGASADSAYIAWLPLCHNGGTDPAISAHAVGQKVVVMPRFSPKAIVGVLKREPVGWLQVVPGVVEPLIGELSRGHPIAGVRIVGVMADLIPRDQIERLTSLLGAPYLNTYGTSETSMAPGSNAQIPIAERHYRLSKWEFPFCDVRLVDEEWRDVPVGVPGQVLVRTPMMFSGYWRDERATRSAFREGWYCTGDVMIRSPDGSLEFVGRMSGMIKSGGESVYPEEIERVLLELSSVGEAIVEPKADRKWGEVPVAYVTPEEGTKPSDLLSAEIVAYCRTRLAGYKVPREIYVLEPRSVERNIMGKVSKPSAGPAHQELHRPETLENQDGN